MSISKIMNNIGQPDLRRHNKMSPTLQDENKSVRVVGSCSNKNADDFRHEDLLSKVKYMSPFDNLSDEEKVSLLNKNLTMKLPVDENVVSVHPELIRLSHPDKFVKVVGGFSPPEQLEYDPDNISPGVLVASATLHDPEAVKASLSQPFSENSPNCNKRYYSPEAVDKAYEEYFAKLPITLGGEEDGDT